MSLKDIAKSAASRFVDKGLNKALNQVLGGGSTEAKEGFNVNRMASALNKSGVAMTSHFEAYVHCGLEIPGQVGGERDLVMRIDSIDIPGRSFSPIDHRFTNIGPVNKLPGVQTYPDITATIICSEDLREKDFFEWWQENMQNTGAYEEYIPTGSYGKSKFGHRYFDDYIGRVVVRQYGSQGELKSTHTLNEAYPLTISPISMNWSSEEPARLAVSFAYRNYQSVYYKKDQSSPGNSFTFGFGKGGLKIGASLPGVGNFSLGKGGLKGALSDQLIGAAVNNAGGLVNAGLNAASSAVNSGMKYLNVGAKKVAGFIGL